LIAGLCCVLGLPAFAFEVLGGASARYQHSDNILQSENNTRSENMLAPRVDATLVKDAGAVRGAAVMYAERVDYRHDLLDDENRYNLTTSWTGDIIENRLLWRLDDVAERRVIDARAVDTADNRVDQNYLDTGPDLYFSLNRRDQVVLSARYGETWFGNNVGLDSERYLGRIQARHQMSPLNTLLASYTYSEIDYTERNAPGFDRQESLLGLERELTRMQWRVEAGYNSVSLENGESYDGLRAALAWRQQWREDFYSELRGDYRLTDAAEQIIDDALAGGIDLDPVVSTDVYTLKTVTLASGWQRSRWQAYMSARAEQQDYEVQLLDQTLSAAELGVSRSLSERTSLNLSLSVARRDFVDIDRLDREVESYVTVDHVFSSLFYGAIGGAWLARNSNLPAGDFRETIVFVEFGLRGTLLARNRGRELRYQGLGGD
jgi:hypothetical protein